MIACGAHDHGPPERDAASDLGPDTQGAAGADDAGPSDAGADTRDAEIDGGAPQDDAGVLPPCSRCGDGRRLLQDGWRLQPSLGLFASGEDISSPGFASDDWYPVQVPSTVFAALVANGVYPDPYYGDNLTRASPLIPSSSWWYRSEFTLDQDLGPALFLALDGINYRANVWLNGRQLASSDEAVGTFSAFEWDVSALVQAGENALAIEVFPPDLDNDLALSWFDWNPAPPDRDMGIWQSVYLRKSEAVALRNVRVTSALDMSANSAGLTISADLVNTTAAPVHATLVAQIESIQVSEEVDVPARGTKTVRLDPASHAALKLQAPRLWWPAQLGRPELYELNLSAQVAGQSSDEVDLRFGIRSVEATLTPEGYRLYIINGKPLLIRGGGWASDMLLRTSAEQLEAQFQYVRDLGLNSIRLEGKLESDAFYDAADRYGILVLAGWMCCDHWQDWGNWRDEDHRVAVASTVTQAKRLRNHPSVIDFLIGSDEAPPANVESELLGAFEQAEWPNPICASAADRSARRLGPSGMKMNGPYDWIAPSYWLLDHEHGGAFGFSSEVGPGPAVPELETLQAMLTTEQQESLWRRLDAEQFHAGTNGIFYNFGQLRLFNQALSARHGAPESLSDYVKKAQLLAYEGERAPFEAYGRNKYRTATGIVHWLLNNAWPSLIWHLYSYDLSAAGSYFGAKKGNEPLHVMYSYDDRSVVVLNHTPRPERGLMVDAKVYNIDASVRFQQSAQVDVAADATTTALTIPILSDLSATYFVALTLTRPGTTLSQNFYWLSSTPEQIDFASSDWFHSPTQSFADYRALASLPQVTLRATATSSQQGERGMTRVTLTNDSPHLAFFTRLKLTAGADGPPVWPALWQDNYVSLAPHETRTVQVSYGMAALGGKRPVIEVSGFNQPTQQLGD